jgi:hypothetical protein
MTTITAIIIFAFPMGMLLVAAGGFLPRHRVLIPVGGLICSTSMLPLGVRLLGSADETMDYLMGGQALVAGIALLVIGLLWIASHLLRHTRARHCRDDGDLG